MVGEQAVTVEVEVADQRDVDTQGQQPFVDFWHGGGGFRRVDGEAHQFRPGAGQFGALNGCFQHVGGVGVGHRLDDDRGVAADANRADAHGPRGPACRGAGKG